MKNKFIDDDIYCYFSNNKDGFSKNNTLNLAFQVNDDKNLVQKNREKYLKSIDIYDKSIFCYQSHGDKSVVVSKKDVNRGMNSFEDGINSDCIYTFEKNLALNAYFADCTPIYFYSKKDSLIGIIHAGWQGTVLEITKITLSKIINEYEIKPSNITVVIGPSIGKESFCVDIDVVDKVLMVEDYSDCIINNDQKYLVDVKRLNYLQAFNLGIRNIIVSDVDTFKDKDFFSFRKNNDTGRMLASIINRGTNE